MPKLSLVDVVSWTFEAGWPRNRDAYAEDLIATFRETVVGMGFSHDRRRLIEPAFMILLRRVVCGGHDDLDQQFRSGEPRFTAGPRRRVSLRYPAVPDGVHGLEVAHVRQPDHRL